MDEIVDPRYRAMLALSEEHHVLKRWGALLVVFKSITGSIPIGADPMVRVVFCIFWELPRWYFDNANVVALALTLHVPRLPPIHYSHLRLYSHLNTLCTPATNHLGRVGIDLVWDS